MNIKKFSFPEKETTSLKDLCARGISEIIPEFPETEEKRLNRELETIHSMGLEKLFIALKNIMDFAKSQDIITGPGRGSHAGSLVLYLLKITAVNPLEHGLFFEPFINKGKEDPFETGIDVSEERLSEVIEYATNRYGTAEPFHFINLKSLDILQKTLNGINSKCGANIVLEEIPGNDAKTFDLFKQGDTGNIFMMDFKGMQKLLKEITPSNLSELAAAVRLFGIPALETGLTYEYIKRKQGRAQVEYLHPSLEGILKDTLGLILYREQIIEMACHAANYTIEEAYNLQVKAFRGHAEGEKTKFLEKARDIDAAEITFRAIAGSGKLPYNKAHAVSYAMISYWMAYLKANWPDEFRKAICSFSDTAT